MTLATALVTAKPREKSGPRTGARYAFQVHVCLAKVLDWHVAGSDYRAVFDHFDDLAVITGPDDPDKIAFFQIKGNQSGPWTAAKLAKKEGESPCTPVGKMYHHTAIFGSAVTRCTLLTNASFSFTLADGTKTGSDHRSIAHANLGPKDSEVIAKALDLDFAPPRSPSESIVLHYERTDVPVTGYDTMVKGKLVEMLENTDGLAISALYRTLVEEVTARTNDATEYSSIDGIYARKSLSRKNLADVISAAENRRGILDSWSIIEDELKDAGCSIAFRVRLKTQTITHLRGCTNRSARSVTLSEIVNKPLAKIETALMECDKLLPVVEMVKAQLQMSELSSYDAIEIDAAIFVELFEAMNGK
ncbi:MULTISPECIES: dsDNA nuclease domain-containing protein [unclassified Bradyrhizobium]|uniref:dsDNA nuclease domain-containing protein n=1 Tax=unclassified Bradyrhizobium TaxID=2631580 RepID=UPI0029168200|nr:MULTISPECIES: dsDNA nuclease domain-containing protein [unclassified Bradyrhizobium]